MQVVDFNAMIGPTRTSLEGKVYDKESLLGEMDEAQVDAAVVCHSLALQHDPSEGNRILMDEISRSERLLPSWVLLPHQAGEMPDPEELVQELVDSGVVQARIFPKTHSFSPSEWSIGALLTSLEDHRVPLLLDVTEVDYDTVEAICSSHPRLPVVVTKVGYRADRILYPLLERHPNLLVETSTYQTHRGLESVCRRFGASRLIFGSAAPELRPGPMAMTVRYAMIEPPEKDQILGLNFEQLRRRIR